MIKSSHILAAVGWGSAVAEAWLTLLGKIEWNLLPLVFFLFFTAIGVLASMVAFYGKATDEVPNPG